MLRLDICNSLGNMPGTLLLQSLKRGPRLTGLSALSGYLGMSSISGRKATAPSKLMMEPKIFKPSKGHGKRFQAAPSPPLALIHPDAGALPPEPVHDNAAPPNAPFQEIKGSCTSPGSSGDEGASSADGRGTISHITELISAYDLLITLQGALLEPPR